jgi:hypothetical protein
LAARSTGTKALLSDKAKSAYNTIVDIHNTPQVNRALKQLDSVEDRINLIDKVVERRNEKKELQESININRLQPLLEKLKDKFIDSTVPERKGRKLTFLNLRRPPSENFESQTPSPIPTPSKFFFAKSNSNHSHEKSMLEEEVG